MRFARFILLLLVVSLFSAGSTIAVAAENNAPDSVYLLSYATEKNRNHNGLHFAWSRDQKTWHAIGNEFSFLRSDYGRWGSEKRMLTPFLVKGPDQQWHCVWALNERDSVLAHASSYDLINWSRQTYLGTGISKNFARPVVRYNTAGPGFEVFYAADANDFYRFNTTDFKSVNALKELNAGMYPNQHTFEVGGAMVSGQVHRVSWETVDRLIGEVERKQFRNNLQYEQTKDDATRFAGLKPVQAKLTLVPENSKPISDLLMGIFFEDINYAADGGLYAELIQNRGFEYDPADREGNDKEWNSKHSWELKGAGGEFRIETADPIHENNPHYAVIRSSGNETTLINKGFDGIPVKKGERYDVSLFSKHIEGKKGKIKVRLVDNGNAVLAEAIIPAPGSGWKKSSAVLTANADAKSAVLEIQPLTNGSTALDMISLFPKKTFKGRKNGLRADLAQAIADIHPRFVRFPGGCVAHGDGLNNMYRWPQTVGPLEARKPQRNLWGYHQTGGLGYFEYFQFCEDIGAEPVPVVPAGVPCQNSGTGGAGQQGGIPMDEMDEYVQEVLDLIEYANGSAQTKWGKVRAQAGHPEPFHLKYVGVGNEDLITDVFEERFKMIFQAVKEKHPEITVIGTVGPFFEGTDYMEGWKIADQQKVPMVDEHYYQPPGWFIHNQDFYDSYDRSGAKVYLGEYASHLPGRPNNLETALSEALYLTALERNGDVVSMASYAPLLAKEGHTQWNPDLIYFNNTEVKPTVGYHVQKLYGTNAGDEYIPARIELSENREGVRNRIAYSVVRDTKTGDLILKMVNMLPVPVEGNIDFKGMGIQPGTARKTVLTGDPADKSAKPVESEFQMGEFLNLVLPPYSFTVIRL